MNRMSAAIGAAALMCLSTATSAAAIGTPPSADGGIGIGGVTTTPRASTPTHTVPTRTTPTQTLPVRTAPTHTVPVRTAPTHTVPVRSTPTPTVSTPTVPVVTKPVTTPSPPPAAPPTKQLSKLQNSLKRYLKDAGGQSSAVVLNATRDQTLFSDNPNARRLPASVEKLYTTSTALLTLGPSARFTTAVLGSGTVDASGTYHGPLYLKGGGDPTFGDQHFDQAMYGEGATIQQLVAQLKQAGIKKVYGPIVGDSSYFDSRGGGPTTGYRPSTETEGELSGLSYDAGFTTSAETLLQPQPAKWAAGALAAAMSEAGIKVPQGIKIESGVTPANVPQLATVQSPPLSSLIELTNSPSDNFFAETLLKDIAAHMNGVGSTAAGAKDVESLVAQDFGLDPTLNDGSGLSRGDRTTAAQIVSLLQQQRTNSAFYNSLAIAGVRGTMREEMRGTRAADNCRGKTGTLHDVANLVGYCTAANGDKITYAFLMNGLHDSTRGHEIEDLMGEAVADY